MAILVLGGAGYIGSHTVYELIEQGEKVVIVDNLETGNVEAIHQEAKFYKGDIRDKKFMDLVFEQEVIEAVIHFAASSIVAESMVNPLKYYDHNVYGTQILLQSMMEHNVKKIVFSSTAAIYGEPEHTPILERDKTDPTSAYGETKLSMEKMMRWAENAHGLKYVALRYFNACGAHKSGKIGESRINETHLIPLVLQVPLGKRKEIVVFGDDYDTKDGTCIRDYIHVTDLAQAHILAVKYLLEGKQSNSFNLGNGVGFTVKEVIQEAEKITNHKINKRVAQRRMGDPARLVASSQKARELLGWKPEYEALEDMIQSAWKWHHTHPDGFVQDDSKDKTMDLEVKPITDKAFRAYGKVLQDVKVDEIIEKMQHTPLPDDVIYIASEPELEVCKEVTRIQDSLFGGMPIQVGYCNGHNHVLDAVEYHRNTEINIAATDLILILGKEQDVKDDFTYDTRNMEAFFVPKGTTLECYGTTLHYAPCSIKNHGFKWVVILPEGTNTLKPEIAMDRKENQLLFAKNKWLIAHPESELGKEGAFEGLKGPNWRIL